MSQRGRGLLSAVSPVVLQTIVLYDSSQQVLLVVVVLQPFRVLFLVGGGGGTTTKIKINTLLDKNCWE